MIGAVTQWEVLVMSYTCYKHNIFLSYENQKTKANYNKKY